MIDNQHDEQESISVLGEVEKQLEEILKNKKAEIEKVLEEKISREREEAKKQLEQIEEDMMAERQSLADYKNILSEYEVDKREIQKRIQAHLDNVSKLRGEIGSKTGEALEELKKIDELNNKLEELARSAEEKINSLKQSFKDKFGIQPELAAPEDIDETGFNIRTELDRLNQVKALLESDQAPVEARQEPAKEEESREAAQDEPTEEKEDEPEKSNEGYSNETASQSAAEEEIQTVEEKQGEEVAASVEEEEVTAVEVDTGVEAEVEKEEEKEEAEEKIEAAGELKPEADENEIVGESEAEPVEESSEEIEKEAESELKQAPITEEQVAELKDEEEIVTQDIEFEDFGRTVDDSVYSKVSSEETEPEETAESSADSTPEVDASVDETAAESIDESGEPEEEQPDKEGGMDTEIIELNTDSPGSFLGQKDIQTPKAGEKTEEKESEEKGFSKEDAEEMLSKYRKTEGAEGEGEVVYFENAENSTLDGEYVIDSIASCIEHAKGLYDKLSRTNSPKDQFFVKQEIIQHQENIRKLMLSTIRMCEKDADFLPSFTHEVLNLDMLKEVLEKVSMENWSNPEDFLAFEEFIRKWKEDYYKRITPADEYLQSIIKELKIV